LAQVSPGGVEAAHAWGVAKPELAQDGDRVGLVCGVDVHVSAALGAVADGVCVLLEQPDQREASGV
jgi:putative NIF3 family GTP cyclohydrolase 1 type 2